MPKFKYKARTKTGAEKSGEVSASDKHTLSDMLKKEGLYLVQSEKKEEKKVSLNVNITSGVSLLERVMFARHLAIMLKSGLSISKALRNIKTQTKNKHFKEILEDVYKNVEAGNPLAKSMAKYPKVFNEMFTSMIDIGEISGNLDKVLMQLSEQMQRDYDLIKKVKGAMYYPVVVLLAMVGIAVMLVIVVMPKLIAIFESFEADLPWSTELMINATNYMLSDWPIVLGALIALIIVVIVLLRTKGGKGTMSRVGLRIPKVGKIIKEVNTARFARALSSMLKSGVPVVKALEITSRSLGNTQYREALLESSKVVKKGDSLSLGLAKYANILPPVVNQIISVGEQTGTLDEVLDEIASFYEAEVDQDLKNISSIIEPVLMLILGAGVAVVAISVISPIYSLTGTL